MALSRQKKEEIIAEVTTLLEASKLTVVADYRGTTVSQLQALRKQAQGNGTKVKVVKNRLFKQALAGSKQFKDADNSALTEQLIYAFNDADEVEPARALHNFSKKNPTIKFVGAFSAEGAFIGADEVKALAVLPSKDSLIASVMATLESPINDVMSGLSGGLGGIMSGLEAKAGA